MQKLFVKKIEAKDIGALFKMSKDFNHETPLGNPIIDDVELQKKMFHILENLKNDLYVMLIAYYNKQPSGFLLGYVTDFPYGRPSRMGIINELYVDKKYRSRITGLSLIVRAIGLMEKQGVQRFIVTTTYGGTDKRWANVGVRPYLVYGWIDNKQLKLNLSKALHLLK